MNRMKVLLSIVTLATFMLNGSIIEIDSEAAFNSLMADNANPTVVKFAADWCGACQAIKKPFEDIANNPYFGYITFYHVNIDKVPGLTKKYNIIGVPTFIFMEGKKESQRESGVKNINIFEKEFTDKLKTIFPKR